MGTDYPIVKRPRSGAGIGKNMYLHVGIGFLAGRVRVSGCEYGMTLPSGIYPLPPLCTPQQGHGER